jgi:hypothetical protein
MVERLSLARALLVKITGVATPYLSEAVVKKPEAFGYIRPSATRASQAAKRSDQPIRNFEKSLQLRGVVKESRGDADSHHGRVVLVGLVAL